MRRTGIFGISAITAVALLGFAMTAVSAPAGAQTYTDLYNFGSNSGDPLNPQAPGIIAQGRDGNLYSTTPNGGANGVGAVFRITPDGTLTVLYSFDEAHGVQPYGGLTLGTDGNFYGTTSGGYSGLGTIFKITPSGRLKVLHSFTGSDGKSPIAPPIQGSDGYFYGTTKFGGAGGTGTVYKLAPSGTLTTLYQFDAASGECIVPLVEGTDGNFYGTTLLGGANGRGSIFEISPKGKLRVLQSFGKVKGENAQGPLIQGDDGEFYGTTTLAGSTKRGGTIFSLSGRTLTVLRNFNDYAAYPPVGGLVQGTDGNFYGSTPISNKSRGAGILYQINPQGDFSVLYRFEPSTGSSPQVTLLNHTNGVLYGDTPGGGDGTACNGNGCGVFYSFDAGLAPFAGLVTGTGKVGKTIGILGQGLTGTTSVSFNGTAANFTVESDTFLEATIPPGATTGYVTVTTPGGTLTSNKQFIVKP